METATMVGRSDQSGVDIIVPSTPQTGRTKRNRQRSIISYKDDREVSLPELRRNTISLDRSQPLPTSLQSDFIPAELLFALTEITPPQEQLGPPSKQKRSPSVSQSIVKKSPASMWNFPTQRDKYRHLTDSTPCICGAGQDISFLYDVQTDKGKMEKPNLGDESELRHGEVDESKHTIQLPDTLIPTEYHIVKNKGVLGLDYFDDKYGLELKDHVKHLVLFPSMHPTTRYEVLQLKKTMFEMLEKVGIDDEYEEVKGPTQMHSLLELMKKEQNVYNVVFHELIRQVSVHCVERGSLLAEVRDRYSKLLSRVPRQIKGLHEEVLAQRALDRRLTEELLRFKTTISFLTSELTEVKGHDREVTTQANQALDDLKTALGESQRNAALLAEYHDLYELQRQRLERQVNILSSEKELWSTAAYSLALKVTEEHSLNTAKRLHVSEKAWAKLANHFTVLLSDRDTEVLIKLQSFADTFRDILDSFSQKAVQHERSVKEKLMNVMGEMHGMKQDFQKNIFGRGGELQSVPDMEKVTKIYSDIKRWGAVCSDEMERFGGESLLSGQDTLRRLTAQVEGWTDCAIQLFNRHNVGGTTEHPNHAGMLRITEMVEEVVGQFQVRISGENGVAARLISLGNSLESIENKMSSGVHGANPMLDQEWMAFYQLLDDWCALIDATLNLLGNTCKEDDAEGIPRPKIEVFDVIRQLQRWLSTSVAGIDSEDAKLVEAVTNLHTDMVQWMVHMLLRLAPNRKDASREAREALLLNTQTVGQLQLNGMSLFEQLQKFTKYVTSCCADIVREEMQRALELQEDNADHEYKDLQKLQAECNEWIKIARLLLQEVTGQPPPEPLPPPPPVQNPPKTPKLADRMSSTVLLPTMTEEEDEDEEEEEEEEQEVKGLPSPPPIEVAEMVRSDAMEPFPKSAEKVGKLDLEAAASLPTMIEEEGDQEEEMVGGEEEAKGEEEGQPRPETGEEAEGGSTEPTEDLIQDEDGDDGEMKLEVLGADANTYLRKLQPDDLPDLGEGQMVSPPVVPPPMTPDSKKAFESLQSVYLLQQQLLSAEERAQEAEERITDTEQKLKELEQRNRELESRLANAGSPVASNTSLTPELSTLKLTPQTSQHAQQGSKQASPKDTPQTSKTDIPPKDEPAPEGKEKQHKEKGRGIITKPKSGKSKSKK